MYIYNGFVILDLIIHLYFLVELHNRIYVRIWLLLNNFLSLSIPLKNIEKLFFYS